jgi:hypothetical protein
LKKTNKRNNKHTYPLITEITEQQNKIHVLNHGNLRNPINTTKNENHSRKSKKSFSNHRPCKSLEKQEIKTVPELTQIQQITKIQKHTETCENSESQEIVEITEVIEITRHAEITNKLEISTSKHIAREKSQKSQKSNKSEKSSKSEIQTRSFKISDSEKSLKCRNPKNKEVTRIAKTKNSTKS